MSLEAEITNNPRSHDLGYKRKLPRNDFAIVLTSPAQVLRKSTVANYHRSMPQTPTPLRSHFTSLGRWLRCFALALLLWLAATGSALAQKGKPEPEEPKGYFLSYTLLVLCLVLGAYCTARPSKRTSELRKEVEEE